MGKSLDEIAIQLKECNKKVQLGFIGLFAPLTDCSSMQEGMIKK